MEVKIVRIDKNLPLPNYETPGSAAFDFYSRIDATVPPLGAFIIPSNLIIEVPKGFVLILSTRSSLFKKTGLILVNGIGVIDQDYSGPRDEIGISVYNTKNEAVEIKKGERIAQGLILPIEKATWQEKDIINKASRGGFGSTGHNAFK